MARSNDILSGSSFIDDEFGSANIYSTKIAGVVRPDSDSDEYPIAQWADALQNDLRSIAKTTVFSASFPGLMMDTGSLGGTAVDCRLYAGSGAPDNSFGSNGDYFFRTDSDENAALYIRTDETWTAIGVGAASLDIAYNGGRTVTVDAGAVQLQGTAGSNTLEVTGTIEIAGSALSNGDFLTTDGPTVSSGTEDVRTLDYYQGSPVVVTYTNSGSLVVSASNATFDKAVMFIVDSTTGSSAITFSSDFKQLSGSHAYVATSGTVNIIQTYCRSASPVIIDYVMTSEV